MCRSLVRIQWDDPAHAIPAFATIVMMPLTYSIAYGIITGLFIYTVMEIVFKVSVNHEKISILFFHFIISCKLLNHFASHRSWFWLGLSVHLKQSQ